MNIAIFGADQISQTVTKIIEEGYNPWLEKTYKKKPLNVIAYVVENIIYESGGGNNFVPLLNNKAVLNIEQFASLYKERAVHKIIFPREIYWGQTEILSYLRQVGVKVEDVCITQRLRNEISLSNFIELYHSAKYLPYLGFHICDHCNLNCNLCDHYSSLVKKPHFTNLEKFTQDFERLHEFIHDIGWLRILGGEPLLNPEINDYIKLSRRLYPQAVIHVVTNALLLTKMPEEFFDTLRKCNAAIWISFYPPLKNKMSDIHKWLTEMNIQHDITNLNETFECRQTLKPHNDPRKIFLQCHQSHCHSLYDGKIAACFLPFTTKYFNAYYGKNLPEDGALNLYDPTLTTEKLKAHLLRPFERCRYCTPPVAVEWTTIKNPSPITDWVHD